MYKAFAYNCKNFVHINFKIYLFITGAFNPPLDKAGNPVMKKGPRKGLLAADGNPQSNNPDSINHGEDNF